MDLIPTHILYPYLASSYYRNLSLTKNSNPSQNKLVIKLWPPAHRHRNVKATAAFLTAGHGAELAPGCTTGVLYGMQVTN